MVPFCPHTQAVADLAERAVAGAFTRVGCPREQGLQPTLPPRRMAPGQPLPTVGPAGARPACRPARGV